MWYLYFVMSFPSILVLLALVIEINKRAKNYPSVNIVAGLGIVLSFVLVALGWMFL